MRAIPTTMQALLWVTVLASLAGAQPADPPTAAALPAATPDPAVVPTPAEAPAATAPAGATQSPAKPANPGEQRQLLRAVVIEIIGTAQQAPAGVAVLDAEGWQPLAVGDQLTEGTQIRTGLGARVNLQFGESTFVSVRPVSVVCVAEAFEQSRVEVIRLDLGYGTLRGSSSEGELTSNLVVETPVATLAKRGTEGWQISVEPYTGRFDISLSDSGLVEAIQSLRAGGTRSRLVRPGEAVDQRTVANLWLGEATFRSSTRFQVDSALTEAERAAAGDQPGGFASLAPGGSTELLALAERGEVGALFDRAGALGAGSPPRTVIIQPGPIARPEGNFGTAGVFTRP